MNGKNFKGRQIRVEIADAAKMEKMFEKFNAKVFPLGPGTEFEFGDKKTSTQSDQKAEPKKDEKVAVLAAPPGFEAKTATMAAVHVLPRKNPEPDHKTSGIPDDFPETERKIFGIPNNLSEPERKTSGIPNDFPELVEKAKKFLHESKIDFHRRIAVKLADQPPVIIEPEMMKPKMAEIAIQTAANHVTKDSIDTQTDPVLLFDGIVLAGKNEPEPDAAFESTYQNRIAARDYAEPDAEPDAAFKSTSQNPNAAFESTSQDPNAALNDYERYWQMYYQQMPINESGQWYNNRMTQYEQMAEMADYFARMFNNQSEN